LPAGLFTNSSSPKVDEAPQVSKEFSADDFVMLADLKVSWEGDDR
jgi:hypothetical protein